MAYNGNKLFTSESVTEGHPDKVCDQISDAVLDAVLEKDPMGRVACETCCTKGLVILMGEITTAAKVDYTAIARKTIVDIGYDRPEAGFDGNLCAVLVSINEQSPDIALGTDDSVGGAGDQGMMFGYACKETADYMPLPITLANRLAFRLSNVRKTDLSEYLYPDGKTQVTVEYDASGNPVGIDTILVSSQHSSNVRQEEIREMIREYVVEPELEKLKEESEALDINNYKLLVNPTGRFVIGGPAADTGLTGRKIIVDTYGGYAAHGGGAFSGKDPTKVDRSSAYAARYIAKNIVAAGIADKCQVQMAYAIGVPEPVSVMVDTYGTSKYKDHEIVNAVYKVFDMTPKGIIEKLKLRNPVYRKTAAYGHFGNTIGELRPWEELDSIYKLRNVL